MFSVIIALVILLAGVAVIYLLLKNMSEDGVDIAAPGSCKRGRCGPSCRPTEATEQSGEVTLQTAEATESGQPRA